MVKMDFIDENSRMTCNTEASRSGLAGWSNRHQQASLVGSLRAAHSGPAYLKRLCTSAARASQPRPCHRAAQVALTAQIAPPTASKPLIRHRQRGVVQAAQQFVPGAGFGEFPAIEPAAGVEFALVEGALCGVVCASIRRQASAGGECLA